MVGATTADTGIWRDAEQRLRAELRRIDDVADDLRAGTRDLRWEGPGAGRFRWRTERRLRELADQRWLLHTALTLVQRAAGEVQHAADAAARADAQQGNGQQGHGQHGHGSNGHGSNGHGQHAAGHDTQHNGGHQDGGHHNAARHTGGTRYGVSGGGEG